MRISKFLKKELLLTADDLRVLAAYMDNPKDCNIKMGRYPFRAKEILTLLNQYLAPHHIQIKHFR
jgi:hypothetical protein